MSSSTPINTPKSPRAARCGSGLRLVARCWPHLFQRSPISPISFISCPGPGLARSQRGSSTTPSLVEPAISPHSESLETDFITLADKARDSRDWPVAARYYRQELEQRPINPAIWVQYGHALKESGNRAEAENAYRKSLDLDPNVPDTHLQLGHVLKIQGKRSEAS